MIRFPFDPIRAVLPPVWEERAAKQFGGADTRLYCISTETQVALLLGVDRRRVYTWAQRGVSTERADEIACRAGYHPSLVWGDLWWQTAPVPEPEPGGKFCGRHPQHKEREAA